MRHTLSVLGLLAGTVLAGGVIAAAPAAAASSCVAQSVAAEHALYGTAWGHDVVGYLASHPEILQEFGFRSFGELASYAAAQDPADCPPDL